MALPNHADHDDLLGLTVDRFEIIDLIASGGMARVYRAIEHGLERPVALKVLPREFLRDDSFLARFEREAREAGRLSHPNVLPVFAHGRSGDIVYIAMPIIHGGSLHDRLRRGIALDFAGQIVRGVARGLDYAHSHGVVHRDVKPSNILLGEGDWPLLADFGIAKLLVSTTSLVTTGRTVGTVEYMSPEQWRNQGIDGRSDQYALGIVAYELLTGSTPFHADNFASYAYLHAFEPPQSLRERNPAIGSALDDVVMRAIEKRPEHRFESCRAFADAFDEALREQTGTAIVVTGLPPDNRLMPLYGRTQQSRVDLAAAERPSREDRPRSHLGEKPLASTATTLPSMTAPLPAVDNPIAPTKAERTEGRQRGSRRLTAALLGLALTIGGVCLAGVWASAGGLVSGPIIVPTARPVEQIAGAPGIALATPTPTEVMPPPPTPTEAIPTPTPEPPPAVESFPTTTPAQPPPPTVRIATATVRPSATPSPVLPTPVPPTLVPARPTEAPPLVTPPSFFAATNTPAPPTPTASAGDGGGCLRC